MKKRSQLRAGAARVTLPRTALRLGLALLPLGYAAGQASSPTPASTTPSIPVTRTNALDGHEVSLPEALPGRANVLILGFGRHSADATTPWEKAVRTQLAHPSAVGFYDMAMLAEVPSFVRSLVLRSIRKDVPDVLKPNFLPLFDHEDDWKHVAGYVPDGAEAAYVMLVDRNGVVRWSTHEPFSPAAFRKLSDVTQELASH